MKLWAAHPERGVATEAELEVEVDGEVEVEVAD